ncbi:MAG: sigma-70 family RNA polymerase sigma factor [Pseudomonadota bacterium]
MTEEADISDEALLVRIATGDEAAMRLIYERHHGSVVAFAKTRLNDQALVFDVAHEVMLDVWRKPQNYSGRSSFRTWLYILVRNKTIDAVRRSSRIEYGEEGMDLVDQAPLPDDVLQKAQDADRMRSCVDGLSAPHKSAIHLTFFEGLTIKEAAEVEGVPDGTIKTRIFHAKKLLAACLQGQ